MPIFTKAYNLKHIGIQGYNYIVVCRTFLVLFIVNMLVFID